MYKKIDIKLLSILFISFVILQLYFSFYSSNTFYEGLGIFQLVLLTFFVGFFLLCRKMKTKQLFVLIGIYQLILVLTLFFYYVYGIGNPLGYHPTDAVWYNHMGQQLQHKGFVSSISFILSSHDIGDIGFPMLLKYIYVLPGYDILNMKLFNIAFHLLTCYFLYKIAKLLKLNKKSIKYALILYGLNPISIYFSASGRKEPFFVLVVTLCFYLLYKAIVKKKLKYFILGFLALLATGLFRVPYPILILFSFGLYYFMSVKGRHKTIIRLGLIFSILILFLFVFLLVGDALSKQIAVNRGLAVKQRLGTTPGVSEYGILFISGLIGPFPTFHYEAGKIRYLLKTAGIFVKIFFSYFFIIGVYEIIKNKLQKYYPLLVLIVLNIMIFTFTGATLDYRYHFPVMSLYFIVIGIGYSSFQIRNIKVLKYGPYYVFIIILILLYNFYQ